MQTSGKGIRQSLVNDMMVILGKMEASTLSLLRGIITDLAEVEIQLNHEYILHGSRLHCIVYTVFLCFHPAESTEEVLQVQ